MSGESSSLLGRLKSPREDRSRLRVVDVSTERANELLEALSTETARELYLRIQREPAIPTELAEELDTSLQNVHYHLDTLEDAGLVEAVDTEYSEKGVSMTVYGAAYTPLVISFDAEERVRSVREAVKSAFLAIGGLTLLSALVEVFAGFSLGTSASGGASDQPEDVSAPDRTEAGDAPADGTQVPRDGGTGGEDGAADTVRETVTEAARDGGMDLVDAVLASPGATTFVVGLVALSVVGIALYLRRT